MKTLFIYLGLSLCYFNVSSQVCQAFLIDFNLEKQGQELKREKVEFYGMYELTFCRCGPAFDSTKNSSNASSMFSLVQCHLPTPNSVFPIKIKVGELEMTILFKLPNQGFKDECSGLARGEACRYELGNIHFREGMYVYEINTEGNIDMISEIEQAGFYDALNQDYEYKDVAIEEDHNHWRKITRWWR